MIDAATVVRRAREEKESEEKESEKRKDRWEKDREEEEEVREERERKKKEVQSARKGRKVARGSKSRLALAAARSHLVVWEILHALVALWHAEHLEVKMWKTPQFGSAFGSLAVQKVHVAAARSTSRSQNGKSTSVSERFWKFGCSKSARSLWRKARFEVKIVKNSTLWPLLDVQESFSWQAQWILHLFPNWANRVGFVSFSITMAGMGQVKRICKDGFRVAGAVQETFPSEMLGGQGADFLRGVKFWSIRSSALLRWFCVTGAALRMTWHHFFADRYTDKY